MGAFSHFFANRTNYMSPDGNFVVVILCLVYFTFKCIYFKYQWVKSREFPKMKIQIVRDLHFRKFINMVGGS